MMLGDTIAAISSAVGPSARMILRLSGPRALGIASELCRPVPQKLPGSARTEIRIGHLHLPARVILFQGPRSYSGEDLAELHIPGNPLLARLLFGDLLQRGARPAEPGEFTARAFFSGRIDLAEAEGVAMAVAAQNAQQLRSARQLMSGQLTRRLQPVLDGLADLLALVEAGIDFSEEDLRLLSPEDLRSRMRSLDQALETILSSSTRWEQLAQEPTIVLAGRPNAGKSTLLNALAGRPRAVVSPLPGTTRDVIWAEVVLPRGIVRLLDAAGLQDDLPGPGDTSAQAEIARQMHAQALRAVESADCVVLVRDLADMRPDPPLPRPPDLVVLSKLDQAAAGYCCGPGECAVSAMTGMNLDLLRSRLDELVFGRAPQADAIVLNARHVQEIRHAREALSRAQMAALEAREEIVALELRQAADALGRILGHLAPDDILARIFRSFCIGK